MFFKTNIKEIKKKIKMHNINLGICVGWSETIPKEIINNIELGCIGFHPTMLPKIEVSTLLYGQYFLD